MTIPTNNELTEDEALQLWCPMVRVPDMPNRKPGGNAVPEICRCIGSRCAMWRWSGTSSDPWGYCGLGGEP